MRNRIDEWIIHTERLTLRPLTTAHYPALFPVYSDPEAMRFMPTPPHTSPGETAAHLMSEHSRAGTHSWGIWLNGTADPIGHVDFLGETQLPGMGYILHRRYWRQGITTEACRAVLQAGFDRIGYDRMELWIDSRNLASQRVAAKLDFHAKGRIQQKYMHRSHAHTMLIFGQWAHEWRGEAQPPPDSAAAAPRFFSVQPTLFVPDVMETAVFYRDKLGFYIDFLYGNPPNHGAVSRGDWTGSMVTIQLAQRSDMPAVTPSGYLYIFVNGRLDSLHDQYRAAGVEIMTPPTTHPYGMREFTIRDLNGHVLRFGTPD